MPRARKLFRCLFFQQPIRLRGPRPTPAPNISDPSIHSSFNPALRGLAKLWQPISIPHTTSNMTRRSIPHSSPLHEQVYTYTSPNTARTPTYQTRPHKSLNDAQKFGIAADRDSVYYKMRLVLVAWAFLIAWVEAWQRGATNSFLPDCPPIASR